MTISADHRAAIERLPTTPRECQRCGRHLVCVILTTDPRWATSADPSPPRFGCPRHDVVLGACVDAVAPIYTAVLRDPADSHWAWVHEDFRGPVARAGILAPGSGLPARVTTYRGRVWVGDARCLVATPEASIEAVYERMGAVTDEHRRWGTEVAARLDAWLGDAAYEAAFNLDAVRPVAGGVGEAVELGGFAVPNAFLDAQLVELVSVLHPDVEWWVNGPLDPVCAWVGLLPVAVVMPLRWQGQEAKAA